MKTKNGTDGVALRGIIQYSRIEWDEPAQTPQTLPEKGYIREKEMGEPMAQLNRLVLAPECRSGGTKFNIIFAICVKIAQMDENAFLIDLMHITDESFAFGLARE